MAPMPNGILLTARQEPGVSEAPAAVTRLSSARTHESTIPFVPETPQLLAC